VNGKIVMNQTLKMIEGKISPSDIIIEEAVLSSLIQEKNAIYEVMNIIDATCFYKEEHQKIYQAILDLCHENKGIDLLTVTNKLRTQSLLEEVGGPLFITQLSSKVSSTYNLKTHGEILKELAIKRGLIRIGGEIQEMAYDEEQEAKALMNFTEAELYKLNTFRSDKDAVPISVAIQEASDNMEKWGNHQLVGIRTGFNRLDSITGGWLNTDLIIIAGMTSMGKTLSALQFILTAAEWGTPVAFFSLEMARSAISTRMICMETGYSFEDIRSGLTQDQWGSIEVAIGKLEKMPIWIDDTPKMPILELISKSRRLKLKHNIGLIVIDYLQYIQPNILYKNTNKNELIGDITSSLKALAKELNVPVICLSQLNRATEQRADKRPQLSNLRDSGNIEQDSDIVIFVHRPEKVKDPDWTEHNVGEFLLEKHRNGRLGKVLFRHAENLSKIFEY
jgi:replicative DNA helicase